MRNLHFIAAGLLAAMTVCLPTPRLLAAEPQLASIEVSPPDVQLNTLRDRQSLIVQAVFADGLTRDVTAEAKFTPADASLVRLEGTTLYPAADGETQLTVEYGGRSVTVPVKVQQAAAERPISFRLDVMPVFMKASCNNGSCHGAARGKDGFRLSLFGFDPEGDHYRLTHEISGRRINLALPEESLMIKKATGQVPHTGGTRFAPESELNETLLRWLRAGAPNDQGEIPQVVSVELYPKTAVLDGEGATQKLT
ncbi:MAG: cell surface protein, partial [Planctomycetaceae bacterium]